MDSIRRILFGARGAERPQASPSAESAAARAEARERASPLRDLQPFEGDDAQAAAGGASGLAALEGLRARDPAPALPETQSRAKKQAVRFARRPLVIFLLPST